MIHLIHVILSDEDPNNNVTEISEQEEMLIKVGWTRIGKEARALRRALKAAYCSSPQMKGTSSEAFRRDFQPSQKSGG